MMREIRFSLDWGVKYPLWESGTDKYAMEPSDYNLSDDLSNELRNYVQFWNDHLVENDVSFDWDSSENEMLFDREGDRLLEWLRSEVNEFATVKDGRH